MCIPVIRLRVNATLVHWFKGMTGSVVTISLKPPVSVDTNPPRAPFAIELPFSGKPVLTASPQILVMFCDWIRMSLYAVLLNTVRVHSTAMLL